MNWPIPIQCVIPVAAIQNVTTVCNVNGPIAIQFVIPFTSKKKVPLIMTIKVILPISSFQSVIPVATF